MLEINPQHPLVQRLNRDLDDPHLGEWAQLLYSQAVLTLGARLADPAVFVAKLNDLLVTLTQEEPADAPAEAPAPPAGGDDS